MNQYAGSDETSDSSETSESPLSDSSSGGYSTGSEGGPQEATEEVDPAYLGFAGGTLGFYRPDDMSRFAPIEEASNEQSTSSGSSSASSGNSSDSSASPRPKPPHKRASHASQHSQASKRSAHRSRPSYSNDGGLTGAAAAMAAAGGMPSAMGTKRKNKAYMNAIFGPSESNEDGSDTWDNPALYGAQLTPKGEGEAFLSEIFDQWMDESSLFNERKALMQNLPGRKKAAMGLHPGDSGHGASHGSGSGNSSRGMWMARPVHRRRKKRRGGRGRSSQLPHTSSHDQSDSSTNPQPEPPGTGAQVGPTQLGLRLNSRPALRSVIPSQADRMRDIVESAVSSVGQANPVVGPLVSARQRRLSAPQSRASSSFSHYNRSRVGTGSSATSHDTKSSQLRGGPAILHSASLVAGPNRPLSHSVGQTDPLVKSASHGKSSASRHRGQSVDSGLSPLGSSSSLASSATKKAAKEPGKKKVRGRSRNATGSEGAPPRTSTAGGGGGGGGGGGEEAGGFLLQTGAEAGGVEGVGPLTPRAPLRRSKEGVEQRPRHNSESTSSKTRSRLWSNASSRSRRSGYEDSFHSSLTGYTGLTDSFHDSSFNSTILPSRSKPEEQGEDQELGLKKPRRKLSPPIRGISSLTKTPWTSMKDMRSAMKESKQEEEAAPSSGEKEEEKSAPRQRSMSEPLPLTHLHSLTHPSYERIRLFPVGTPAALQAMLAKRQPGTFRALESLSSFRRTRSKKRMGRRKMRSRHQSEDLVSSRKSSKRRKHRRHRRHHRKHRRRHPSAKATSRGHASDGATHSGDDSNADQTASEGEARRAGHGGVGRRMRSSIIAGAKQQQQQLKKRLSLVTEGGGLGKKDSYQRLQHRRKGFAEKAKEANSAKRVSQARLLALLRLWVIYSVRMWLCVVVVAGTLFAFQFIHLWCLPPHCCGPYCAVELLDAAASLLEILLHLSLQAA